MSDENQIPPPEKKHRRINVRQRKFVKALVRTGSTTEAYKLAGYESQKSTVAKAKAFELLRRPSVQNELEKELDKLYPSLAKDTATVLEQMAQLAMNSDRMIDKKTFIETISKVKGWEAPKKSRVEKLTADLTDRFKPPRE